MKGDVADRMDEILDGLERHLPLKGRRDVDGLCLTVGVEQESVGSVARERSLHRLVVHCECLPNALERNAIALLKEHRGLVF